MFGPYTTTRIIVASIVTLLLPLSLGAADKTSSDGKKGAVTVKEQHQEIGIPHGKGIIAHSNHPEAQWFPQAGLGLFIHWGINSVKEANISWPMIPGRALGKKKISDPAELQRIIRESDYNLNGKKPDLSPNQYWALAKEFKPLKYDPDRWCKAAKEAGFTYAVFTTRHHDGFSMWPSDADTFNTKLYLNGQDLVKPFVEACRKNGLKVGLYYSPPNWYYEKDTKNFLHFSAGKLNPELPMLDADHKPVKQIHPPVDRAKFEKGYDELVRKQIEELLTRYGKIDVLWFDGTQSTKNPEKAISLERIRELQPGILVNPRLHGSGDFVTYERDLTTNRISNTWGEFCNTWTTMWVFDRSGFRSTAFILKDLIKCRSLGLNYLLGIGPDRNGELHPDAYANMKILAGWIQTNGVAIYQASPLPAGESSNVPATAFAQKRFLMIAPEFEGGAFEKNKKPLTDVTVTLTGLKSKPKSLILLTDQSPLDFTFENKTLTVRVPVAKRSNLVDVLQVDL